MITVINNHGSWKRERTGCRGKLQTTKYHDLIEFLLVKTKTLEKNAVKPAILNSNGLRMDSFKIKQNRGKCVRL